MSGITKTPVQSLYEFYQRENLPPPRFSDVETQGPSHFPIFTVKAYFSHGDGRIIAEGTGVARNKKQAKHEAAVALLSRVKAIKKVDMNKELASGSLSISCNKENDARNQQPSPSPQKLSPNKTKDNTNNNMEDILTKNFNKVLDFDSGDNVAMDEKQSTTVDEYLEANYTTSSLSSIDRSENDFMELCCLFNEMNIEEEFQRMEYFDTYKKLSELERKFKGNLKVIWSENGLLHAKKTAHSYCIKYKTATIAMTQENGLRMHSDKIREEAAKKAYAILKMIFTNNPQLSTF